MIIKQTVTGAHNGFAVANGIPSQPDSRRDVVVIAGDALKHAQGLLGGRVCRRRRREQRREFQVVAHTVIEREFPGHAPGILCKQGDGDIVEGLIGCADALNIFRRYSEAIRLQAVEGGGRRGKNRKGAERGDTPEIQFEDLLFGRTQLNEVEVGPDLEGMPSVRDGANVRELITALDTIDRRIGLAAEVSVAGNVDAEVAASLKRGESEVQAAARKLEAKFVEGRVAEDGIVLKNDVDVAIVVFPNSGPRVLSKHLVLRCRLN